MLTNYHLLLCLFVLGVFVRVGEHLRLGGAAAAWLGESSRARFVWNNSRHFANSIVLKVRLKLRVIPELRDDEPPVPATPSVAKLTPCKNA